MQYLVHIMLGLPVHAHGTCSKDMERKDSKMFGISTEICQYTIIAPTTLILNITHFTAPS